MGKIKKQIPPYVKVRSEALSENDLSRNEILDLIHMSNSHSKYVKVCFFVKNKDNRLCSLVL